MTGRRIGRLTVISLTETPKDKRGRWWLCKCDCGNMKVVSKAALCANPPTKSCGCLFWDKMALRAKDISGRKFGSLTALEVSHKNKSGNYWLCKCDCGKTTMVRISHLLDGSIKSCGCSYEKYWKSMREPDSKYKMLFRGYKANATKRNLNFHLSFEEFCALITKECFYCQRKAGNNIRYKGERFNYNGIDRIENSIGYESSNCVPCCSICNKAKNSMSLKDFVSWIEQINSNINNIQKRLLLCH